MAEEWDKVEHNYFSTACQHEKHAKCRKVCKYCPAKCMCDCHSDDRKQK